MVIIYPKTNKFTDLKYPYQVPIINIDDKLKSDFKEQVAGNLPKLIIVYDDVLDNVIFLENGVSDELFIECFGEVLDKYVFYSGGSNYSVYKLREI